MKTFIVFIFILAPSLSKSNCEADCCRTLPDRPPMTFTFYQDTGRFTGGSGDSRIDTHGYSGKDRGYLNPDEECTPGIGPVPASTYKLAYCKNVMHETTARPCSFYLDPQSPEEVCHRSDFFIHGCNCCTSGDDTEPPTGGCSAGCIIINYDNRRKLRLGDILIVQHHEPRNAGLEIE